MQMYHVTIEVAVKKYDTDQVIEQLATVHPSIATSPRGWAQASLSLPAENLAQACALAAGIASAAYGAAAIACTVMTEDEFNAREGFETLPELLGATEAAELLGVSRQRVQQMAAEGKLQAQTVGRSLVIPRAAVEAARARTVAAE